MNNLVDLVLAACCCGGVLLLCAWALIFCFIFGANRPVDDIRNEAGYGTTDWSKRHE
jgi:hypothetical protein